MAVARDRADGQRSDPYVSKRPHQPDDNGVPLALEKRGFHRGEELFYRVLAAIPSLKAEFFAKREDCEMTATAREFKWLTSRRSISASGKVFSGPLIFEFSGSWNKEFQKEGFR